MICGMCGKTFDDYDQTVDHIDAVHGGAAPAETVVGTVQCAACGSRMTPAHYEEAHADECPVRAMAPAPENPASAYDVQVGGTHYKGFPIQPARFSERNKLSFLAGCVVKRVARHNQPGGKGRQDLEKAIHEVQLMIEEHYPAGAS